MYFIGSGSLLYQAINYCLMVGLPVDGACCSFEDTISEKLQRKGVDVLKSLNPNKDRDLIMEKSKDGIVFSINNKYFLKDELLGSELRFYNIHNGLVQRYRGIAEVCIFVAICRGEQEYGVTLQQILSGQEVDSGPVISQLCFPIKQYDVFSNVLEKSLMLCQEIFELNVKAIYSNSAHAKLVDVAPIIFTYKDVVDSGISSDFSSLSRAIELGHYKKFLPKLQAKIIEIQRIRV